MIRINGFNVFCSLSLLAAFFVLGCQIGGGHSEYDSTVFTVTVRPEKTSGSPDSKAEAFIDGKYECSVKKFEKDEIVLICEGIYTDAGYLLAGAKYLSLNQPVKAIQDWGYFEGRIHEITPS
jgi:hypothetical protein